LGGVGRERVDGDESGSGLGDRAVERRRPREGWREQPALAHEAEM
jgi:hypothetical protein